MNTYYLPVRKRLQKFPIGEKVMKIFSSCLENFLWMYLCEHCSCNSLWKFTWHNCTIEANFYCSKILQILFPWNEYRIFSYWVRVLEVMWSVGIWFGEPWSFSLPWATFITLGWGIRSTFLLDSKAVIENYDWSCYVLSNRIWPVICLKHSNITLTVSTQSLKF